MARPRGPTGTPATRAPAEAGVAHVLRTYPHDPGTGTDRRAAAAALQVDPERVLTTLLADVDGALVVAVVPAGAALDLGLLAAAVGGRQAALAEVGRAERATGHPAGSISPLGQASPHPTVLDASALAHETVVVCGGRPGLDVELEPGDLIALTGARVAPITRRG